MAYFNGVKIGDKVYDVILRWGTVKDFVEMKNGQKLIKVYFEDDCIFNYYTFDGRPYAYRNSPQALFWDEVKFEIPKRPKIKLKKGSWFILSPDCGDYTSEFGLYRNDEEIKNKALKQIKIYTRLLALRDQECPDSRGYEFKLGEKNYCIFKNEETGKYDYDSSYSWNYLGVYFKTEEEAQKIRDILNSERFDLEG